MALTLMIQGTSSNVGKSLITAALCRIFSRRGLRVFPFKSQNMALNSFVTSGGFEIGRAQALQAAAACREPDVKMNPILLKPEGNSCSQVVLMGKAWKTLKGRDYYKSKQELWNVVCDVLARAQAENDLIIIEGAGSPAEINLKEHEIVNMRVAKHLNAPVLFAADIDRGGVFASLYGTLKLLDTDEQALVKGFIINKFRGDYKLLEPGLKMLADITDGRPTLGVIPYLKEIFLAQEDSVFLDENRLFGGGNTDIAVILLPRISNYDDFDALLLEKDVKLRFVDNPEQMGRPSAIILPGSKTTIADLFWLRQSGLADAITERAGAGTPVVGICGGYQMLGEKLTDSKGIEGHEGSYRGLGLLPVTTIFSDEKKTVQTGGRICSRNGFLAGIDGAEVDGYEIHMGFTTAKGSGSPLLRTGPDAINGADATNDTDGFVSADGRIWGTYFHGIFDSVVFRRAWLRSLGWKETGRGKTLKEKREEELNLLADTVESHIDMQLLSGIIGL